MKSPKLAEKLSISKYVFRSKSSLKYPLNVRKVCARFPDKEIK